MKYITVLDYEAGRVFQYKWEEFGEFTHEEHITNEGHNLTNCDWMVSDDPRVITN